MLIESNMDEIEKMIELANFQLFLIKINHFGSFFDIFD